ncbi:MAG TPA: hypothetical protein ACFYEK_15525 [Candidatus Wunengus sp. YC60]|uniref:hypothetical protein n=1 Tax=Candidatus Wunengus sp. YC60 TaxID=3367697 RepID=UPI004029C07F
MFKRKKIMGFQVKVSICRDVLEAIFDECDKYDMDETGGRIVGYYQRHDATLDIEVCGLIGPGPNARRSSTSFFQDGEYQEGLFRKIEVDYPDIEHLGNWHTHHVNGLATLSSGDIGTYKRIVTHEKHNTDFFYALLVVARNSFHKNRERYLIKHFLFRKGEPLVYEIPSSQVKVIKKQPIFIDRLENKAIDEGQAPNTLISIFPTAKDVRLRDKEIMAYMYPNLIPFFSKQTKSLYWKGNIVLINGVFVEFLILESIDENTPVYSVTLANSSAPGFKCRELYLKRQFDSVWKATWSFEHDLNREIFNSLKDEHFSGAS